MFDVDAFVDRCEAAVREPQPTLATKELLQQAIAQPTEIAAALGVPAVGGLHCLHRSSALTVQQFVIPPGVKLYPNDHRIRACLGYSVGVAANEFYRRT